MKIKISFLDSELDFSVSNIYSLEVHNKKYLYRISKLFYMLSNDINIDDLKAYDKNNEEILITNKIRFFTNYFDFNFNSKKYNNDIIKYIISNLEKYESEKILKTYRKICELLNKELLKLDLPISVNVEEGITNVIKLLKYSINNKEELLDNLLLLIDLETILNSNKILCFINLKQYLSKEELKELYKYATYNSVNFILIDSIKYNCIKEYEKLIIIDENLEDYMI